MKIVGVLIFLGASLTSFFWINAKNYTVHQEIKRTVVRHPELLPNKEMAKITSMGFKNLTADIYWLQAIQYIGGNALEAEYKKYLFSILDLITELNPYFESPYIIGQLLLPDYNYRYEDRSEEEQMMHIRQGEYIGLKGIKNFCDPKKVEQIFQEFDLQAIWNNPDLQNPCKSYIAPYYLAYIYFFYLNEPLKASNYYKVTSAQDDAPQGAKILAAIMQGKGGEREKSIFMFLGLAESVDAGESACKVMSQELQNIYAGISNNDIELNGGLIKAVEETRKQVFPEFNKEIEEEVLGDTKCTNFLNKAIRELNLLYVENGNRLFQQENKQGLPARTAKALYEDGYIDFLPTDYQQYENHGIIYQYNYDTERYDYSMGNY